MKILLLIITISSIRVESAMNQQHMIRMTAMSRMRNPTPFRPGVNLRWNQKGPSQRNPFMNYRGAPNRYNKYPQSNPARFNPNTWKASPRQPPVSQAEADLVRAAASAAVNQQQIQQKQPSIQQPVQQQPISQQSFQQQPIQHQSFQQQPIQQQPFQPQPSQQQPFQQQPIQQQPFQPQPSQQQPFQQQSFQQPYQQQPFQQQHQLHRFSQNGGTGAIHTIPAPNLSFSEKPIVVLENTEHAPTPNPAYVTSVSPRPIFNFNNHKQNGWKDPSPIKFGPKPPTDTRFTFTKGPSAPELTSIFRNPAALQFVSEYGFNAMTLPPTSVGPHQTLHHHTPLPFQGFQGIANQHEFLPTGVNSIIIPPNMYQPNPGFMQQLQKQLLQRYPAVEFVPYHFDQPHQIPLEPQQSQQNQVFVANSITPAPIPQLTVIPLKNETKTQVVRETLEATVTSPPQALANNNVTENIIESVSITDPQNATVPTIAEAISTEASNGTEKPIIDSSTENYNTTPIFYAQVGQSLGNFEANGLYTAINDARASLMADSKENSTSTTEHPDLKTYFIQSTETDENNNTINDIKPLLGVPFTKSDTVKIAYTLVRNDDNPVAISKDGSVYAGQIVEASISDDQDFIKEKAGMLGRRPPIRLVATTVGDSQSTATPKLTVVKAKIPPKSKLTFDDRTGEPILRIYASYLDSPLQKEIITSKLASIKHVKEISARKEETPLEWSRDTYRSLTKHTEDPRTTQFGHTDRMPTTRAERTQPLSHSAKIHLLSHTERSQPSTVPEKKPIPSERNPTSERTVSTSERIPHTSERAPSTEKVLQSSERVSQIPERVAQTSDKISQASESLAQITERIAQTSERVQQTSERLLTSETMPATETVPMTSERYTHSYPETTFTINTERSRPFERRPEPTPTLRPERKITESRGFERGTPPQIIQRDSYSKVSQFGHGHSRKPIEHSSVKPSSGRAHDNAIDADRKLNSEINIGQFGLKLKNRMDDIVPIFEDK